jgi:hypothetical protein
VERHATRRQPRVRVPTLLLLVLMASTLLCIHTVPVSAQMGRIIDVFTQNGGEGANQSNGMFQPQDLVLLYALVTYNDNPVASKLVGFQASGPLNNLQNLTAGGSSLTNESGIAEFSFRIPWPSENPETKVFGIWNVIATVDVADQQIVDTLTFQVGWIIRITNITTLNAQFEPETNFLIQNTIIFNLTVENTAGTPEPATITIDAQDSQSYPILHIQLDNLTLQPGTNNVNASTTIPDDAKTGQATASAAPYTRPIEQGGVLYSPAISTTFQIVAVPALTYSVTFAQTGLDSSANGTVVTVNGTAKGFVDLPFTVWVVNGSTLSYSYGNVSSSNPEWQFILTGITGPSSPLTVTSQLNITGHYGLQMQGGELLYSVTFAQTGLDSSANGTVVTVNGTAKGFVDLPFTVWVVNGSTLSYSYGNVSSLTVGKAFELSNVEGSPSPIIITGPTTLTGHYKVQTTLPSIPKWMILALFFGLVLIAAIILMLFLAMLWRRRRRKKLPSPSYTLIVHPHV